MKSKTIGTVLALSEQCQEATALQQFLAARYAQLKEEVPGYSFRAFSVIGAFGSPNCLKLVMEGKRNMSPASIGRFAAGLLLTDVGTSALVRLYLEDVARRVETRLHRQTA